MLPRWAAQPRGWGGTVFRGRGLVDGQWYDECSDEYHDWYLLQYLDALRVIGSAPSSKIVVPMELAALVSGIVASVIFVMLGKRRSARS